MILITDNELSNWSMRNDTSVNPVLADDMYSQIGADGSLEQYIVSRKPYGGALIYATAAIPDIQGRGLAYLAFDTWVTIPATAMKLIRCLELDLKVSLA